VVAGEEDLAGLAVGGGGVGGGVDEEEEEAAGAGFEGGKLPAAPAFFAGRALGDETRRAEVDAEVGGGEDGDGEEGEQGAHGMTV
jgi:hypothetical protein